MKTSSKPRKIIIKETKNNHERKPCTYHRINHTDKQEKQYPITKEEFLTFTEYRQTHYLLSDNIEELFPYTDKMNDETKSLNLFDYHTGDPKIFNDIQIRLFKKSKDKFELYVKLKSEEIFRTGINPTVFKQP